MGRILLIRGDVRPDGQPIIEPRGAWIPSWSGGTREHPGTSQVYASDLKSSAQRIFQRPRDRYVRRSVMSDVAEFDAPLTRIGRAGLILQEDRSNDFASGDWDFSTWTGAAVPVTSGKTGPTGVASGIGQAYELNPNNVNNKKSIALGTLNTHTTTYVCSMWVRIPDGTADHTVSLRINGGTVPTLTYTVTKEWQRIWIPTITQGGATSHDLFIFPGGVGDTDDPCWFWGPVFEQTSASDGSDANLGTTVEPTITRVLDSFSGPFAWPAPPWTAYVRYTPLWGGEDDTNHEILSSIGPSTTVIAIGKTAANAVFARVIDRDGGNNIASIAVTHNPRVEQRMVVKCGNDGTINGWLNETAFTTNLTGVYPTVTGKTLALSDSSNPADVVIHQVELWDEDVPAQEFFGIRSPLRRAA